MLDSDIRTQFRLEVITEMFKICNKKFKGNENGLTSLLQYVITPKSTNSEIIIPIIVTKSLKFELVPFFMNQTLFGN